MKCHVDDCRNGADPDGGGLCIEHGKWTAAVMTRFCEAVETAIAHEDGLDGLVGEKLLREVGYWPPLAEALR